MNATQPPQPHRSRIPKIVAVACSLVLMAGYVHFSATGNWFPSMNQGVGQHPRTATATSDAAQSQTGQSLSGESQSAQPIQTLFPDSKRGAVFPGSKSRMLINPQEDRSQFFGGSKSLQMFDEHDVAPAPEASTSETPSTQPETGE